MSNFVSLFSRIKLTFCFPPMSLSSGFHHAQVEDSMHKTITHAVTLRSDANCGHVCVPSSAFVAI